MSYFWRYQRFAKKKRRKIHVSYMENLSFKSDHMISLLDLNSWSCRSPVGNLFFLAPTGTTLGELGAAKPRPGFFQGGSGVPRGAWGCLDVCDDRQFRMSRVGWLIFGMNEVIPMKAMWPGSQQNAIHCTGIHSPDENSRPVKSSKSKGLLDPMQKSQFGKLHDLYISY